MRGTPAEEESVSPQCDESLGNDPAVGSAIANCLRGTVPFWRHVDKLGIQKKQERGDKTNLSHYNM
jgi:hypothetical protein